MQNYIFKTLSLKLYPCLCQWGLGLWVPEALACLGLHPGPFVWPLRPCWTPNTNVCRSGHSYNLFQIFKEFWSKGHYLPTVKYDLRGLGLLENSLTKRGINFKRKVAFFESILSRFATARMHRSVQYHADTGWPKGEVWMGFEHASIARFCQIAKFPDTYFGTHRLGYLCIE